MSSDSETDNGANEDVTELDDRLRVITIVWDTDDDSIDVSWEGLNPMEARGVLISTLDMARSDMRDWEPCDEDEDFA